MITAKAMFRWVAVIVVVVMSHTLVSGGEFEKAFRLIKSVPLDPSVFIGYVSILKVTERGDFLASDRIGKALFLFDPEGRTKVKISPEKCHPGFVFDPLSVGFDRGGHIYVVNNASPSGYRFSTLGECLGPLDPHMIRSRLVDVGPDGAMYILNWNVRFPLIIVTDSMGRKTDSFGEIPDDYAAYIYRIDGGGIVCDQEGHVYVANVAEPRIYKYSPKGKLLQAFGSPPSYHRRVEKLASGVGLQPGGHIVVSNAALNKTLTHGLFLLDANRLLLSYDLQNGTFGLQILDLEGNVISSEEILFSSGVAFAGHNHAYIVEQPPPDHVGNLPNPVINVYEYVLERK